MRYGSVTGPATWCGTHVSPKTATACAHYVHPPYPGGAPSPPQGGDVGLVLVDYFFARPTPLHPPPQGGAYRVALRDASVSSFSDGHLLKLNAERSLSLRCVRGSFLSPFSLASAREKTPRTHSASFPVFDEIGRFRSATIRIHTTSAKRKSLTTFLRSSVTEVHTPRGRS